MLTTAPLDISSLRLSAFYKVNQNVIYNSMIHVASGKRVSAPSDNAGDYFYAKQMNADAKGLQQVQREMSVGSALLDSAKAVGSEVFEDMSKLKELVKSYYDISRTADEQDVDKTEFNTIRDRITSTLNNGYYDKWKLVADNGAVPLMKIILDPRDPSTTFDISFDANDVTDVSGLTLGSGAGQAAESAALDTQIGHAGSYLAKANVYYDDLAAQHDLTANKVVYYSQSVADAENDADGAALMRLVRQNVCQQISVSMLAQANMYKTNIAALAWGK
jgi:flagellin-like hook-associated protein FlgL